MLSNYIAKYKGEEDILSNEQYDKVLDKIAADTDFTLKKIIICKCAA